MKKTRNSIILDAIGWAGTVLVIGGYGAYAIGLISDVVIYHIFNLFGSLGVLAISTYRRIWQPVVINSCFALFALIAIIRHYL